MRTLCILILMFLGTVGCLAGSTEPAVIADHGSSTSIGKHVEILTDSSGTMTVGSALSAAGYEPCSGDVPNLQVSRAAHWLRFQVRNSSNEPRLSLSIPYAEIDELDLYLIEDGGNRQIAHTGRSRDRSERIAQENEFVFDLPVATGEQRTFLIRVRGFKPIHVPLLITSQSTFSQTRAKRNLFLGAYAGIMLVMALYNLFVFFSIRDSSYFLYVLYIIAISSAQLAFLGIGPVDLLHGSGWLTSRSSIFFALTAVVLGMEFARRFIVTKEVVPKLHKAVPFFFLLVAIDLAIYAFGDPWIGYQFAQAVTGWTAIYLLIVAGVAWRRRSRQAGFFLMAWASFLVGVIVFVLKDAGVLPFTTLTQHAMPIGSAIEGVLLSFGLADRINILRREKERSQAEALKASLENERIIREQNAMLEVKVTERTHALQESNDHLKRTQTQLVNAEKMASLGQLTAGIAHEINNPVNFITSNIPPLRRNLGEVLEVLDDYRKAGTTADTEALKAAAAKEKKLGLGESITELGDILGSIQEGADRTAEIVRGLRNFSRLDEDDLKPADINDCLRSTVTVLGPQFRDQVTLDLQLGAIPRVECFAGKLNQVFMNMLNNAAQAVKMKHPAGLGRVTIATALVDGQVVVSVRDNGVGMTDTVKARIYEPFFTTKDVGEGTGLGLSIAYSIVEKHHGSIQVDSTPGEGSEFRVILPLEQPRTEEMNAQRA